MVLLFVLLLLYNLQVSLGDITGTNPPNGTCLCVKTSNVNVRGSACGSVIGSTGAGNCYVYKGNKQGCTLSGTFYEFFNIDFNGMDGWIAGTLLQTGSGCSPPVEPDKEFRAAWIATVYNIDWPTSSGLPTTTQQQQLLGYLDLLESLNMNGVIFQIRPAGDTFYSSTLEPWSRYLTGTQGQAPSPAWDPLQFIITEGHRRNIEIHAWLNPYRANLSPNWNGLAPNHMANRMREHAHPYGNNLWMDPGATEVVDHLNEVIMDVITRYDVDGIHFDDYFYPYPVSGVSFPDTATYNAYIQGGGSLSRENWRRDNVNKMLESVYNNIKAVKRHVKFGISPFGLYRPGHSSGMPSPIAGFDPYTQIYADSKHWLQQGWLDYFAPQLYWAIDPPAQSYRTVLDWWILPGTNSQGRHVYAGNGLYKMSDSNNWPATEIENQVQISRDGQSRLSFGNIFYSAKYLRDNTKGLSDILKARVYTKKVLIPEMPWLEGQDVPTPMGVRAHKNVIFWNPDTSKKSKATALYKVENEVWKLEQILPKETSFVKVEDGVYGLKAVGYSSTESRPITVSVNAAMPYSG